MPAKQPDVLKLQIGVLVLLAAIYFFQIVTPLRLHPDAVILLSLAESFEHGHGFLFHGQPTVFPPGYPILIATLMRLHIAHVWILVGISMACLVSGLLAVRPLLETFYSNRSSALTVCILTLLSFVVIKYSTMPLTDTCFFGVAMGCLAVLNSLASRLTIQKIASSLLLLIIAISLRRIGLILIPVFLWAIVGQPQIKRSVAHRSARWKIAGLAMAAAITALVAWEIYNTSTLRDFTASLGGHGVLEPISRLLDYRLKELGEIIVNWPAPALSPRVQNLLPYAGFLTLLLVLGGVIARRKQFNVADIFFISYALVILVWPFYDPRFWLPVMPLLIAYAGLSMKQMAKTGIAEYFVGGYLVWFVVMGLVTLASSIRISVSGSRIGDVYTEEVYHETYCAAGYCKGGFDSTQVVDPDGLHLLRTFK
jgi:hypothetical protein